jgi:hypothetical protein
MSSVSTLVELGQLELGSAGQDHSGLKAARLDELASRLRPTLPHLFID